MMELMVDEWGNAAMNASRMNEPLRNCASDIICTCSYSHISDDDDKTTAVACCLALWHYTMHMEAIGRN